MSLKKEKLDARTLSNAIMSCPDFKMKILDENGNIREVKSVFTKSFQFGDSGSIVISAIPMEKHRDIIDGTYTLWDESWFKIEGE